jgi:membrane-bound lytic murein transglycosylase D
MSRSLLAVAALLLSVPLPSATEELLPRPAGLEPAVRFWTRVYTEVDGQGGLIHDTVHLDVVYEVVRFPAGLSDRSRERRVEKTKKRYRAILEQLAKGRRSGLTAEQSAVLRRWPPGVSNATLKKAARSLRFQLGQADKFRAGLIRSGAWRAHIEDTLRELGVPGELVALPHVESSYNPRAYSRVGAAGMWQFTRQTGRRYLRVDHVVDERLDPFKSTTAAARLLRDNYRITHAWPLAITAYNHGASGMRRASQKLGTRDIATIVRKYKSRTFGFASRNFYVSFLAASAIDKNPVRHFGLLTPDAPIEDKLIELPHYYPAQSLARALGIDMATLRDHNLSLRPSVWNGSKYIPRGYALRIPRGMLRAPSSELLARVPANERLTAQHRDRYYKVRRGDTLSRIATRYGTSERKLMSLNNLRSRHRIRAGQVLILPDGSGGRPVQVAREDPPEDGIYRVRRGDSISSIARRFGVSESELVARNTLRNRHRIAVGDRLVIPGAQTVAKPLVVADAKPVVAPVVATDAGSAREPAVPASGAEHADPRTESARAPIADAVGDAQWSSTQAEPAEASESPARTAAARPAPEKSEESPVPAEELALAEALTAPEEVAIDPPPASEPAPPETEVEAETQVATPGPAASETPTPDPSDYAVHARNRITVQADETLGHYAEWLEVRASQLRSLNRMSYKQDLVIGRSIRLDFSQVSGQEFERRRLEYHQTLQEEFFDAYVVTGTEKHTLRRGDTVWYLATRKYRVPVWLLRQYNPDLDFGALPPGSAMVVPQVEPRRG